MVFNLCILLSCLFAFLTCSLIHPSHQLVVTLSQKSFAKKHVKLSTNSAIIPKAFDWRDHGVVTPVKSQGNCWSGWAFATIANIEGVWAVKNKQLVELSEQQLLDCDKVDKACLDGRPATAYDQILKAGGGLESAEQYPYKASPQSNCSYDPSKAAAHINGFEVVSSDEQQMAVYLLKNGPIAAFVNSFALLFYKGGILHPSKLTCWPHTLDHGVTIVGYGQDEADGTTTSPFWIVKNSWGPSWGENGYFRIYRGDGTCGINQLVTSAVVF